MQVHQKGKKEAGRMLPKANPLGSGTLPTLEEQIRASYGFSPDPALSTRQNAQRVLGDTPASEYFNSPSNLAFHDLAGGAHLPRATRSVLGLSLKHVVTPEEPTSRKNAMESFENLEKSLNWKVLFAKEDSNWIKNKLYLKSKRIPPSPHR